MCTGDAVSIRVIQFFFFSSSWRYIICRSLHECTVRFTQIVERHYERISAGRTRNEIDFFFHNYFQPEIRFLT